MSNTGLAGRRHAARTVWSHVRSQYWRSGPVPPSHVASVLAETAPQACHVNFPEPGVAATCCMTCSPTARCSQQSHRCTQVKHVRTDRQQRHVELRIRWRAECEIHVNVSIGRESFSTSHQRDRQRAGVRTRRQSSVGCVPSTRGQCRHGSALQSGSPLHRYLSGHTYA